jgi:hypothetical protein
VSRRRIRQPRPARTPTVVRGHVEERDLRAHQEAKVDLVAAAEREVATDAEIQLEGARLVVLDAEVRRGAVPCIDRIPARRRLVGRRNEGGRRREVVRHDVAGLRDEVGVAGK